MRRIARVIRSGGLRPLAAAFSYRFRSVGSPHSRVLWNGDPGVPADGRNRNRADGRPTASASFRHLPGGERRRRAHCTGRIQWQLDHRGAAWSLPPAPTLWAVVTPFPCVLSTLLTFGVLPARRRTREGTDRGPGCPPASMSIGVNGLNRRHRGVGRALSERQQGRMRSSDAEKGAAGRRASGSDALWPERTPGVHVHKGQRSHPQS
jgi:hypothetical protein